MSIRTVTTQSEFDQAVKDSIDYIDIKSSDGVWIEVSACDSSTVRAYDSSTVIAHDSSTVTAKCRVAVHLHSGRAHAAGGVLIDHTQETGGAHHPADHGHRRSLRDGRQ